jgi:hypothetical protein
MGKKSRKMVKMTKSEPAFCAKILFILFFLLISIAQNEKELYNIKSYYFIYQGDFDEQYFG